MDIYVFILCVYMCKYLVWTYNFGKCFRRLLQEYGVLFYCFEKWCFHECCIMDSSPFWKSGTIYIRCSHTNMRANGCQMNGRTDERANNKPVLATIYSTRTIAPITLLYCLFTCFGKIQSFFACVLQKQQKTEKGTAECKCGDIGSGYKQTHIHTYTIYVVQRNRNYIPN